VTESVVNSVIASVDFSVPKTLPETICIDEFKGSSGTYNPATKGWDVTKFHCNIADGDAGCIIDILPDITLDALVPYFFSFSLETRRKVKFFACDMHGGFISLAKRCFPDVTVCIDMFHVVKLLNTNVDGIRTSLQKKLLDDGDEASYKILKHSARLLKTALPNRDARWGSSVSKNELKIEALLSLSPNLREAYSALQEFHLILRMDSYAMQRAQLTEWLAAYSSSECPSTRTVCNTIRHYRRYIQNSWKYGKSNGPCEGLNKKIKDIKRNASGEHSFENFRRRILFSCGYSKFVKETYTMFSEKQASDHGVKEAVCI
jgi:transposase